MKIVTVEEMRAIERAADAAGLSYGQMMENAGRAVAEAVLAHRAVEGRRVAVLAGTGNNGGDGLVAAHHLAEAGATVGVYLAGDRPAGDPHLERLQQRGLLIARAEDDQRSRVLRNLLQTADVVLDAVLGTGTRLPLRGTAADVLSTAGKALAARSPRPFVVAVDCPSGVDCDSGEAAPQALAADLTVTLAAAKRGLLRPPAAELAGELEVAGIGLAPDQPELAGVQLELATAARAAALRPPRPRHGHKGTFGRAVIVAGSLNYPGAAGLAGIGALRVGAGLVTLAVPSAIQSALVPLLPEATWLLLPHELGALNDAAAGVLQEELGEAQAMLIGPGFGLDPVTAAFLRRLLGAEDQQHRGRIGFVPAEAPSQAIVALPPVVVDADGLKLLAQLERWPARLPPTAVLTPHPGEMAVLTGQPVEAIQADREAAACAAAQSWGHVVVLKGAHTVIAEPGGSATVLPFATSALAHAGTGDVLAGAIAGLLAQGLAPYDAAVLAGYLHGRAGELAAESLGSEASVLASEVADMLPAALAGL